MNKKLSQERLSQFLAVLSLILWLISLKMIGFLAGQQFMGTDILLVGLLFGWITPEFWTVYSNIFYIFAVFILLVGEKAKYSVAIMVLLAPMLCINFLLEIQIPSGDDLYYPIISWGWGAFLLLVAQSLIVISSLLIHKAISVKSSFILIALLIFSILCVGGFGVYQRNIANEWEKENYFPTYQVAFTKETLSRLPYKALTEKIPDNIVIEVKFIGDIAPVIKNDAGTYPNYYWQNGKLWTFSSRPYDITNRCGGKFFPPNYRLEITQPKINHYHYTLYRLEDNRIIYQQPFLVSTDKKGKEIVSPPLYKIPQQIIDNGCISE